MSSTKSIVVMISADDAMIEIYKDLLTENKVVLKIAARGEKAFKMIKEKKPAVVIVDMAVAGENGFDVIEKLQKYQTLKKIPVVVLSHLSDHEDVKRARALKVKHYCLKLHCHPERIVERVMDLIED